METRIKVPSVTVDELWSQRGRPLAWKATRSSKLDERQATLDDVQAGWAVLDTECTAPPSGLHPQSSFWRDAAVVHTERAPAGRVSRFPLRTLLHAYLRGVLRLEGRSTSLVTLRCLLRDELPAETLPAGLLRDLVYSVSFDVDTILLHVNNFLHAVASRAVAGAALRQWLIFVWLECLRLPDPPRAPLLGCLSGIALVADA